jgi:nickel transport protein
LPGGKFNVITFNSVRFLAVLALVSASAPAFAHGVNIQSQTVAAIAVVARYDSGEPMAGAQVLVYAPDNPQEPWLTGVTDAAGNFTFTPNDRPGHWEVTVRQAGHGAMVTVPWQNPKVTTAETLTPPKNPEVNQTIPAIATSEGKLGALSPVQRGITIGAMVWGFVGTALFFSRDRSQGKA